LQAVIDCVVKSYTCYELDPVDWTSIREASLEILTLDGLKIYQQKYNEEDLQFQWNAAVAHHPFGANLVLGQLGDNDMRALDDSDNWEDSSYYDAMKKDIFLAYQQVKAHKRFLEENPDEVAHFSCFQAWYQQQASRGHVLGVTSGDDGFWASENVGNELE
jgi:hypothetical protein